MPTLWAYSFPVYFNILIPLLTRMAIPPRLPLALRSSWTWYPGISSFTVECCSHVSYIHSTSILFVSKIIWSLNKLTPAMLILPTVIPAYSQRVWRSILRFLRLADPFVFLFFYHSTSYLRSCYPFPIAIYPLSLLFIFNSLVAHAQRGAFPLSKPAGL